jgi:acyl-CoA thioesterase FadM
MYQAALLATFATDWLGAEQVRRFTVRFQEQVWPGDELTASGVVTQVDEDSIEVDLTLTRQTGGVAIRGSAAFAP